MVPVAAGSLLTPALGVPWAALLALVITGEGLPAPRLAGERVFAEAATIADSKVGGPTIESRPR